MFLIKQVCNCMAGMKSNYLLKCKTDSKNWSKVKTQRKQKMTIKVILATLRLLVKYDVNTTIL